MRASIKEAECGINTVGKAAALQAKELPGNPSPASVEHRNRGRYSLLDLQLTWMPAQELPPQPLPKPHDLRC